MQIIQEPTVPYYTTMIHSLGVFEKLSVLRNHKISALGYLNSGGQSALLKDLYQQRMSGKNMQGNGWCEIDAYPFCDLALDEYENNISHVVPENDDTTIENNGHTEKQYVGDSESVALLKRGTVPCTCIVLSTWSFCHIVAFLVRAATLLSDVSFVNSIYTSGQGVTMNIE